MGVISCYKLVDISFQLIGYSMRPAPVAGGTVLTIIAIIAYYIGPSLLSQSAHSFITSMTSGNGANSIYLLHEMGYPRLSVVIAGFQYGMIATAWVGIGLVTFGLVAKKASKPISVKLVGDEHPSGLNSTPDQVAKPETHGKQAGNQVGLEVVNNVLTKLETQLKDIKTGYENHRQIIEDEKNALEQKERERMAKIISAGEVLIKEITPDRFEERVRYYVGLKNDETGQPIDLSLLADKFNKMKKMLDSKGKSDLTSSEFDSFKRFLD